MRNSLKENREFCEDRGSRNLGRLFVQLQRLEKNPRSFGEAGPLTPSEIHTIDAIGCGKAILMSELASRLSITKGAVTQMVKRLESRNLVQRTAHPEDSRAALLSLTPKGVSAYRAHRQDHLHFYDQLRAKLTQEEIEIFETAVEKLCELLKS